MIQHLSKYTILFLLLFTACNFLLRTDHVTAQSFQVRGAGNLKIIQGGKIGKSPSFFVRDRAEITPNRTHISTTMDGVAPILTVVTSTTGSVPNSDNSIIGGGSGGRGKYDASKWILDKKYEELVLEGLNKPHLASAPKNNTVIFNKHGKPLLENSKIEGVVVQEKSPLDLDNNENNILTNKVDENIKIKNLVESFVNQKIKNIKKLDLNRGKESIPKFSDKLLASIIFDLENTSKNLKEELKFSAPKNKEDKVIIKTLKGEKVLKSKKIKTLSCSNLIFQSDNTWRDISVTLLWVLTLLVIIIFLLAILVICMYYEKKINKNIMPFWKRIAKFLGILSLTLFLIPLASAATSEKSDKNSDISYQVSIQENRNSKLEISGDLKKGERKVVNINDVYLWIFNQEKNTKPLKKEIIKIKTSDFYWQNLAYLFKNVSFILLLSIFFIALLLLKKCADKCLLNKKKIKRSKTKKILGLFLLTSLNLIHVQASVITTPQLLIYEGDLLDTSGNPLAGNYDFRFSIWTNADYEATDIVAGSINDLAPDYLGWQEVQGETLELGGAFSLKLGTITPFGVTLFNQDNLFLQVEIKSSTSPDTSYEVIDINLADDVEDRKVIASVPFAFNANRLDYRELGFGAGEIPYIDNITGKLPTAIIPASAAALVGGINGNMFTLDLDGNALPTDDLKIEFGSGLGKFLAWSKNNNQFEFNDNLSVTGNLVVSGTINGITIGPKDQKITLSPRYPNSIFEGVGDNGYMYEETENITGNEKNIIRWRTNNTISQEDYSNIIRYTLPSNFKNFKTPALSFLFKTLGGLTDSKIDLIIQKEGSVADELLGLGLNLNSGSWTNTSFNLNPATTWNPEDTMIIKIKMYAKGAAETRISDINLNYITE